MIAGIRSRIQIKALQEEQLIALKKSWEIRVHIRVKIILYLLLLLFIRDFKNIYTRSTIYNFPFFYFCLKIRLKIDGDVKNKEKFLFIKLMLKLMRVIGTTGMPGSGKTEVAKVAKAKGIPVIRMGDLVWGEVKRRGLELSDESVGRVASELRKGEPAIWAIKTIEVIKGLQTKIVVIDGVRSKAEVEKFRSEFPNFLLVGIYTSPATRFKRIFGRGRVDDIASKKAFIERDKRELKWGIGRAIALADLMLVNESSLEEFRKEIARLLG
jgi:dephospho-CoA kinase